MRVLALVALLVAGALPATGSAPAEPAPVPTVVVTERLAEEPVRPPRQAVAPRPQAEPSAEPERVPAPAAADAAQRLFALVNGERTTDLRWSPALAADAAAKARRSASARSLSHGTGPSAWADWQRWGEALGRGGTRDPVPHVHNAMMDSARHRAVITDEGFTHVGIGTAWDEANRVLYVVEHFAEEP